MLTQLNLPPAGLELSRSGETIYIKCLIRKKKLVLTPEEWVRQHIIYALIHHFSVSDSLIGVEVGLNYNGRKKRADIVVYNRSGKVNVLIECKAPEVQLSYETLFQIAQYNSVFNADKLLISNGIQHYTTQVNPGINIREGFPEFNS